MCPDKVRLLIRSSFLAFVSGLCLGICSTGIVRSFSDTAELSLTCKAVISACLIAPISEEFFFRALLIGYSRRCLRPFKALLLSCILFAVLHGCYPEVLFAFLGGLLFGLLFLEYRSVVPPIVAHITANLCFFLPGAFPFQALLSFSFVVLFVILLKLLLRLFFLSSSERAPET